MVSLWIILVVIAAFLWTIVSLIDKFVLSHEMNDPILASVIAGTMTSILFVFASLFSRNQIIISYNLILLSLFAGIVYTIAIYLYYYAVKKGEISKVVSFLSVTPIFVLILAFLFLNEKLILRNYFGIFLIVFGAFLISLKKNRNSEYSVSRVFLIVVGASILLSLRDFAVKYGSLQVSIWSILFWIGIGSGLMSFYLFYKHHPHVRKKAKKGIKHLFLGRFVSSISLLLFLIAVSLGPVSLVSALVKIQVLFIFIGATALSNFKPHFIKEKITSSIILQKLIAITIIIAGAFLIV